MFRSGRIPKPKELPDKPRQSKLFEPEWIPCISSNGWAGEVDVRDFDQALERDPGLRTLPPADPNQFVLTPEDHVLLWSVNIATAESSTDERSERKQLSLNVLPRPS